MSYDVSLRTKCECCKHTVEHYESNYTYNMNYAIHFGLFKSIDSLHGFDAVEVDCALEQALKRIKNNAEELRKKEPENGWGSVDSLCEWLEEIMEACKENPQAMFRVC